MTPNIPILFEKGRHTIISIDPSASHLAYAVADLDVDNKTLEVFYTGMIWSKTSWTRGQRFRYMQSCINHMAKGHTEVIPALIVSEQFFANPKLMFGSSVIPTVNAFIEMACSVNNLKFLEIGPTSWRSIIGLKPIKDEKGKKDFKVPAHNIVISNIGELPKMIPSNIDGRERNLPNDMTDCLCLMLAIAKHHGIIKASFQGATFTPKWYLDTFSKLAGEIK